MTLNVLNHEGLYYYQIEGSPTVNITAEYVDIDNYQRVADIGVFTDYRLIGDKPISLIDSLSEYLTE